MKKIHVLYMFIFFVCKIYNLILFIFLFQSGGFAFLPFLWFINSVWFFREAFLKPEYQEQRQIKTCQYEALYYVLA